jgi:CheY-like chemotaxis protein
VTNSAATEEVDVPTTPHILLVDDSATSRQNLASILERGGYRVTSAGTGNEAEAFLGQHQFDLVLTELIIPGVSGLNLLKQIKETTPEVEVVIVTSNASSFNAIKALRLGAYDFIIKPIDDDVVLFNVVERALEKQSLTRENVRLINDLSDRNQQLHEALEMMRTVNRTCALLASTPDIGEILRRLVESAVEQLRATRGYLLLLDKTGTTFAMKVWVGIEPELARKFSMPADRGISGLVAAKNRPLCIGTDIPRALTAKMVEEDRSGDLFIIPGILSVPLQINDKVAGVVNVSGRTDGTPFSDWEVEFMTTLASHAAIAINNAGTFFKMKKGG